MRKRDKLDIFVDSILDILSEQGIEIHSEIPETIIRGAIIGSGMWNYSKDLQHYRDSTLGLYCIDQNPVDVDYEWILKHSFQLTPPC